MLEKKLRAIAEKSKQQTVIADQTEKNERSTQWEAVKEFAPCAANFMVEFNRAFGKPAAVKVTLNSGEVILKSWKFNGRVF